jgi:U32 family peptidase
MEQMCRPNSGPVELLAPAGNMDAMRAAVENGADAVYFGLQVGLNARDRAANFAIEQLPDVVRLLHGRGVRGYVALNILAFPGELPMVEQTVREIAEVGLDAVLVQDLGLVRLIRAVCPDLEIHASTQMTLTSAESIRVAERLGVQRVVLARELSVQEIRKIRPLTALPLEGLRPWRLVRRLLGPMPDQRIARRAQCQSRPMCAGVPVALRVDL